MGCQGQQLAPRLLTADGCHPAARARAGPPFSTKNSLSLSSSSFSFSLPWNRGVGTVSKPPIAAPEARATAAGTRGSADAQPEPCPAPALLAPPPPCAPCLSAAPRPPSGSALRGCNLPAFRQRCPRRPPPWPPSATLSCDQGLSRPPGAAHSRGKGCRTAQAPRPRQQHGCQRCAAGRQRGRGRPAWRGCCRSPPPLSLPHPCS